MDSPEEIKQASRRISGGRHDGEGRELNLWPRRGRGTKPRWWLFVVMGLLWLADGVVKLVRHGSSLGGVLFTCAGVFWLFNALYLRRTGRSL